MPKDDEELVDKVVESIAATPGIRFSPEELVDLREMLLTWRSIKIIAKAIRMVAKGIIVTGWLWVALVTVATGNLDKIRNFFASALH